MATHFVRAFVLLAILGSIAGCDDAATDLKREIDAALADARALVHTEGCTDATGCAAAPVGAKACGGPREYWTYCRATTDEATLLAKLAAVRPLEQRYNELTHAVSTCSFVEAPHSLTLVDGRCQAVP